MPSKTHKCWMMIFSGSLNAESTDFVGLCSYVKANRPNRSIFCRGLSDVFDV
ncbi:hypothetical protein MHM91_05145 [Neisseriaceae bacterium CCUG 44465]|uniref:hypothetical protein n=1 Tax=Wielerella bovis TaxID=2917790 RepID=UPI002018DE47|nr:hypothetical protein [Wielerella bovis]MCG7659094.1 hypothetical protein [Wielerella bovis]